MSSVTTLTKRIARIETAQLTARIAELEARIAELEHRQMYIVSFDLRLLSKEDVRTLEAINDRMKENSEL